jgi:hypothetical protein
MTSFFPRIQAGAKELIERAAASARGLTCGSGNSSHEIEGQGEGPLLRRASSTILARTLNLGTRNNRSAGGRLIDRPDPDRARARGGGLRWPRTTSLCPEPSSSPPLAASSLAASSEERGMPMSRRLRARLSLVLVAGLTLLMAFALIGLVGPTPAEAQKKKILNIAAKEPDTLDPHSSTLGQSQAIARFMYRGLTRFAIKDGKVTTAEVEPDLAESWTLSPEGTVWTFKLRKGGWGACPAAGAPPGPGRGARGPLRELHVLRGRSHAASNDRETFAASWNVSDGQCL